MAPRIIPRGPDISYPYMPLNSKQLWQPLSLQHCGIKVVAISPSNKPTIAPIGTSMINKV